MAGKDLDAIKARGALICGVGHRHGRLHAGRQPGQVGRPRRRRLPRRLGRHLRRLPRRSSTCRSPRSSASPRCSRARSTSCRTTRPSTLTARHRARPRFHRHHLLRRPGLPGEQEARREERQGAERRHRLRGARHHHRAQPRRLLPRQQDDLQAGRHREGRGSPRRLLLRPLRRLHQRLLEPLRDPRRQRAAAGQARGLHRPAGDHLQGAAGARRCATATTSSPTSCAGRSTPCSRPRNTASTPRTSTRC